MRALGHDEVTAIDALDTGVRWLGRMRAGTNPVVDENARALFESRFLGRSVAGCFCGAGVGDPP
jgi:hypothetical protein